MRIRDHRGDDEPEISLVPLIDVILVMIIFFVVTATFDARSVIQLELPRATGEQVDAAQPLVVLVNAQGRYFVDDREVLRDDVESLKATIAEVAGSDRERPVMLRADARTPYQAVVTVYDALGQLGFRRIMSATASPATPGLDAGASP
ncbi:biopolymer transporter [Lysobacter concretionis Ko07 = DSM 16239]|jgi:biopolymer transport protein ExbD|uniref:Biopolymer transporter n=1 Tax=Lysobacter concretionis Ko07 = DSM 16239 TaxID=1122185 RepID=A0A0A0ES98_9GAMM|nr:MULTISPECIES: biopolymer transporter ExbD [Lysobacter]KGM52042.1 biopolymer transporter [Lysobacter concretionis Ko07 = DSM 16239]QOD90220.1 biopolymer transporter ExbD [Lysobacter sp. CW239]